MKLTSVLKSLLLEKKGDSYDKGCVMLYFNFPQIKEIQDQIDPDDLYTEEGDRTYGLEDESHTTLLFGLAPSVQLDEVVEILDEFTYSPCKIHNVSLFDHPNYDVLKFDVIGANLNETNAALRKDLPYKNEFPNYHPHLTIGYVKKGLGEKYTKMFEGKEYGLIPKYAIFSQPPNIEDKIVIKVKKK